MPPRAVIGQAAAAGNYCRQEKEKGLNKLIDAILATKCGTGIITQNRIQKFSVKAIFKAMRLLNLTDIIA